MITVLPDTETLAIAYLRSVPEVSAIVGSAIASALPSKGVFPFLVVSNRVGGIPPFDPYISGDILQVDAFGRTREQARHLIYTAHAALVAWVGKQHDGSVISGTKTFAGVQSISDPNRSHWLFRTRVWAHP